MFGWLSAARSSASRPNRATRSRSSATDGGRSFDPPLRVDEGWEETRLYREWKSQALGALGDPPVHRAEATNLTVLSDHWMEQEIASLGALGQFELALERAQIWAAARPQKIGPRAALVRLHHAMGDATARDEAIERLLALETRDLNELAVVLERAA